MWSLSDLEAVNEAAVAQSRNRKAKHKSGGRDTAHSDKDAHQKQRRGGIA